MPSCCAPSDSDNNNELVCQDWNNTSAANSSGYENGEVVKFYDGASVFVTGGTGFVGKALIEKLLRSCPELKTIYLLIRPKRGKDIQCRFNELLANPVNARRITNVLCKRYNIHIKAPSWHTMKRGGYITALV